MSGSQQEARRPSTTRCKQLASSYSVVAVILVVSSAITLGKSKLSPPKNGALLSSSHQPQLPSVKRERRGPLFDVPNHSLNLSHTTSDLTLLSFLFPAPGHHSSLSTLTIGHANGSQKQCVFFKEESVRVSSLDTDLDPNEAGAIGSIKDETNQEWVTSGRQSCPDDHGCYTLWREEAQSVAAINSTINTTKLVILAQGECWGLTQIDWFAGAMFEL